MQHTIQRRTQSQQNAGLSKSRLRGSTATKALCRTKGPCAVRTNRHIIKPARTGKQAQRRRRRGSHSGGRLRPSAAGELDGCLWPRTRSNWPRVGTESFEMGIQLRTTWLQFKLKKNKQTTTRTKQYNVCVISHAPPPSPG